MADSKEKKSVLSKVTKTVQRKREKLRSKGAQGVEEGLDSFKDLKANFEKQQSQASRVMKDSLRYTRALEEMTRASKSLGDSIKTLYEPDWPYSKESYRSITELDQTYNELALELTEEFIEPLKSYNDRFPDIKKRIERRERRQLDHHRCKRLVEQARAKGSKKLNELEDNYSTAQMEFDLINDEVHEVLPTFYEGRMPFFGQHFQTLFSTLSKFHECIHKNTDELSKLMEHLFIASGEKSDEKRKRAADNYLNDQDLRALSLSANGAPETMDVDESMGVSDVDGDDLSVKSETKSDDGYEVPVKQHSLEPLASEQPTPTVAVDDMAVEDVAVAVAVPSSVNATDPSDSDIPPANIIETRKASHGYDKEDEDELEFVKGDVIYVLKYPDPEDEEEGWLFGQCRGRQGVFPANFTEPMSS
eukprot:m.66152 g.66152  ORF g.66152 m.66152 type:complete len:419 (-) comp23655_c0_seq1:141-1397(-)